MEPRRSKSLFDDIFRLQNTAPDDDVDPEDPEDGAKARLAEASLDEGEAVGPSNLRKQTAIISDDPKYKGRKASRKDLYSDGEDNGEQSSQESGPDMSGGSNDEGMDNEDDASENEDNEDDDDDDEQSDDVGSNDDETDEDVENQVSEKIKVLPDTSSDDQKKGKAVVFQLGVWDDLIKSRIVLQKLVSACNRLPQPDVWPAFMENPSFQQEAKNVHSSVRKVVSAVLDLQSALSNDQKQEENSRGKKMSGSDEEITSESEADEDEVKDKIQSGNTSEISKDINSDSDADEDDEDMDVDENEDAIKHRSKNEIVDTKSHHARLKRKLSSDCVEETLAKRHVDFQKFRNDTLSKWDEKTRLAHGKIKSKNFAAFEMSVLKQIEQILVNRERLVRRIHQKRSDYHILGTSQKVDTSENGDNVVIEDDDDDVEPKLKQRNKSELAVDPEIIDDNDFYHVCLRDLIEMKQNEETDPVTASKQWLQIQRLRNKQKQKVDTKASKGRKIRYNVHEKLKNYMTPYDKSTWSDEQKDDLFKAMFGGKSSQGNEELAQGGRMEKEESSIVLGI